MHLDTKLDNTIIEDRSWPTKNQILSTTGSKAAYCCGSPSQRSLLPVGGSRRKNQMVVGVGPHDRPVLPPAVTLVRANCRSISNWTPSSKLEVVGANQVHPLPGPAQHVKQLKDGD
jgi:hypothetical protein